MNKDEEQNLQNGTSSEADTQEIQSFLPNFEKENSAPKCDVRSVAEKDILNIQNLVEKGQIDNTQGQYLVSYVINKAYDMVKNQGVEKTASTDGLKDFENENKDFFSLDGRKEVFDYLKNSGFSADKDEVSKISKMVENIEKSAIERYLKQIAHEKTLNDENEIAKKKLRANAQNSNLNDTQTRVFTREQIGKMSGAEFTKYEKSIMEQLRKGLIR